MNIQKVGVLLAMAAVFSASKAKSETTSPDVMRDVFQKPVISAVSTGDLVYTLRPDAEMDVTTMITTNMYGTTLQKPVTETQKYPIQVQSEGMGFAFNFNKDGKCPDFSSMAYNAERDELYFGLDTKTNSVFKITNASQQGLLTQKTIKEERLRSSNSSNAGFSEVLSSNIISFNDWILIFRNTSKVQKFVFHINGVINLQETNSINEIIPHYSAESADKIYISDGKKTGIIHKKDPKKPTEFLSEQETVGLALINDTLFHANGTKIFINGSERNLMIGTETINTNEINHISSDGEKLFVAVKNNLSMPVLSGITTDKTGSLVPTRYIQADKIIPANNGAWAIRKNQMHFYSNSQLSR